MQGDDDIERSPIVLLDEATASFDVDNDWMDFTSIEVFENN